MHGKLLAVKFAVLVGLFVTSVAQAGFIDLVENGEFESSAAHPGRWTATDVDGWQSTEGRIEIWNESFQWGGRLGSDGESTGQHAEITWNHDRAEIWTSFVIPEWFAPGSDAFLSFDYQNRKAQGLWANVSVNGANPLQFALSSPRSWSLFDTKIEDLSAGDIVTLMFKSQKGGSSGAHIDQVQFLVQESRSLQAREASAVPLPGTMALLAMGATALGWPRRRT